jgi:hypothetical protein
MWTPPPATRSPHASRTSTARPDPRRTLSFAPALHPPHHCPSVHPPHASTTRHCLSVSPTPTQSHCLSVHTTHSHRLSVPSHCLSVHPPTRNPLLPAHPDRPRNVAPNASPSAPPVIPPIQPLNASTTLSKIPLTLKTTSLPRHRPPLQNNQPQQLAMTRACGWLPTTMRPSSVSICPLIPRFSSPVPSSVPMMLSRPHPPSSLPSNGSSP